MGCGASAEARIHQKTASRRTHNGASKVGRVQVLVDMNFDDIRQCGMIIDRIPSFLERGHRAPEKDPVALSRVEDLEEVQELPEAVETKTAESKKTKPAKAKAPLKAQVDPSMPFTELEPFGREATGQELTEASIRESDAMIDQIEKAEIAEEERSVFRALTRLRGAALASFDGIARAHQHNIQEYALENQYRKVHPVQHLAEEEADVSRWAFPSNAD
eukprot:g28530.t2